MYIYKGLTSVEFNEMINGNYKQPPIENELTTDQWNNQLSKYQKDNINEIKQRERRVELFNSIKSNLE